MKDGNILRGPNLFDLGVALFTPRGKQLQFHYLNESGDPESVYVFVNTVDNLDGRGTFEIQGFLCGSDGRYLAKYNPMTGEGDIKLNV